MCLDIYHFSILGKAVKNIRLINYLLAKRHFYLLCKWKKHSPRGSKKLHQSGCKNKFTKLLETLWKRNWNNNFYLTYQFVLCQLMHGNLPCCLPLNASNSITWTSPATTNTPSPQPTPPCPPTTCIPSFNCETSYNSS